MSQYNPYRRKGKNGTTDKSQKRTTFKQNPYKIVKKDQNETIETRRKAAQSFDTTAQLEPEKYFQLNLTIKEQQFMIERLQKELDTFRNSTPRTTIPTHKSSKSNYTIKHKDKELSNLRKKLKLAINDSEKVHEHYKKQLDTFKTNQQKWLRKQSLKSTDKQLTKYVFGDDIQKIQLRKHGVRIYFTDGENCVFDHIEVTKPKGKAKEKDDYNKHELLNGHRNDINDIIDDNDMIILMLNELRARVRDFKHRNEEDYYSKIQERYDELPIYHIDDDYLQKLKTNNSHWIRLFKKELYPVFNGKRKGKLGLFFKAQREIKDGKQPMICIQNNIRLNNMNKVKDKISAKSIQNRIDRINNEREIKWDNESKNNEMDEDLYNLKPINILNGWLTAQLEMKRMKVNPSICIKNNITLNNFNISQTPNIIDSKYLQKRLNDNLQITSSTCTVGKHNKQIAIDAGDSEEEEVEEYKGKPVSNIMKGWFTAQIDINQEKQPSICVQNNIILNNINISKKKKKKNIINANVIQEKINAATSVNATSPKVARDSSSDDEDYDDLDIKIDPNDNGIHEYMWYYNDKQRRKFIKSISIDIDSDQCKLLLQIGTYLNRLIPTSIYYEMVSDYFPIYLNPYDIIAACFDGVLLSILINFIDEDLIDLRALHLPIGSNINNKNKLKYPISKEYVIKNMNVVKLSITSLDLHQFPDFGIDFEIAHDDILLFCWFNPKQTVEILLLIIMHQFMGMINKKINIFAYPELFRLCQERGERKTAQKTSCKEWINRWIIYMRKPKIKKHGRNMSRSSGKKIGGVHGLISSIDLGGYHQAQVSSNISWESITNFDEKNNNDINIQYIHDTHDYYDDINKIHQILNINNEIESISIFKQDIEKNRNYLLQLIYLSDLFIYNNKISKLSTSEHKSVIDYLKKKNSEDEQLIAWINSFKILNENSEFQYIDNLDEDIADGTLLLRLLQHCKPGCVDWKNKGIRVTNNIRHKFDKLANCNIVVSICDEYFKDIFHLIGMGGNDIVDQNKKYIRGLLSQIQRYHSTKLFAKILFKKKAVTDEELLLWMNNRLIVYKQMVTTMNKMEKYKDNNNIIMRNNINIKSFSDKNILNDCILFCNIVSSIQPQWIDYKYINDENECKFNGYLFKLQNAKYLITVMRKLSCDNIFIHAKDLIKCEYRAIITISVAIMTTAARYNQYDQLPIFAKTLKQIKEKMLKK